MTLGLIGRKAGMTRVFDESGDSIPVTVLEVIPNQVVQVKTKERDGYSAVQVSAGRKKIQNVTKPLAGHYAKANVEPGTKLMEFRVGEDEGGDMEAGAELTVSLFSEGQIVDAQAYNIGKGFAGAVKRHNFSMQDATHGNSLSHRAPGSIGQNQSPGRVFKGKKMAGHMGDVLTTIQNLKVVRVDADKNMLLIRGAVPGAKGGHVVIRPAAKKSAVKEA